MNITKITQQYISSHPSIARCLKLGLINYSSLARMIMKEQGITENFDAFLVAARRYRSKIEKVSQQKDVIAILKKSKIEVKNKIVSIALDRQTPLSKIEYLEKKIHSEGESLQFIEGVSALTLVIPEEYLKVVNADFRNYLVDKSTRLVEITLKSPKEIESVPGVMAYLFSLLAEHDINVVETFSCWTDSILVISEKDLAKVMELLRF